VSPGAPTIAHLPERAERAEAALRALGFEVSFSEHALGMSADGLSSGTCAERAADLMEALEDPRVDAVIISDSGGGSDELLNHLDPQVLARLEKPFIGFCDTTFISHRLAYTYGLGSYFGSSFVVHLGDAPAPFPETLEYLVNALAVAGPLECKPVGSRAKPLETWHDPAIESAPRTRDYPGGWAWLREGSCAGPFVGGEILTLPGLVRELDIDYGGAVLFWDIDWDTDDEPPIGEFLQKLNAATDLSALAGMLVGANPYMNSDAWARLVASEIDRVLPEAAFPVLANVDLGHAAPSWTVPFGEQVVMEPGAGLVFPRDGAQR
jgi:muramoyltetrapeptide carboxypeptidase LdcA involved in peptidoglycan recycling